MDWLLYLFQAWVSRVGHADWYRRTVSASTSSRTNAQLALDMLSDLAEGSLLVRWVTCDESISVNHAVLDDVVTLELG